MLLLVVDLLQRLLAMGPSGILMVTSYEFVKRVCRKPQEPDADADDDA